LNRLADVLTLLWKILQNRVYGPLGLQPDDTVEKLEVRMQKKRKYGITFLFLASLLWGLTASCFGEETADSGKSLQEVKQELAEAGRAIQNYSAAQRDKAVEQGQVALATLDAQIDELQTRLDEQWDQLSQSARRQARATLATLQQQRNEVAEWYGGMKYSSSNAWDEMKQGFSNAYSALRESWIEAEQEFEKEQPPQSPEDGGPAH
jgi:hypothetical protein